MANISNYLLTRGGNLTLRLLSMGAKFLLVVVISKYLSLEQLGEYGIFVTTITLATFLLGYDFYTYSARQLIYEEDKQLIYIRDQFLFYLIFYIVILPLLLVVFFVGLIEWKYLIYFYFILVFEHLSQELYRLFTSLSKPIFANFLFFIRTSIWVYYITISWYFNLTTDYGLDSVYSYWLICSGVSVLLGFIKLSKMYDLTRLNQNIDWKWIKTGIRVSTAFFIGTIAYKVIEFSDRYMIDYFLGKDSVGIYTFYSNIANALQAIVFTMVIMIYYPKMISLHKTQKFAEFKILVKKFYLEVILYSVIVSLILIVAINPLIEFLGKYEFLIEINSFYTLLVSVLILNLSFVPHYILYVQEKDLYIRNITVIGAVINIILNILLIPLIGVLGAAIATVLSYVAIFLLKRIKYEKKDFN